MVHHLCFGYSIIFTDDAKKDLRKLEKQIIKKIFEKTKKLILPSLDGLDIKKLHYKIPLYRLRMGDYRIVYCIKQEQIVVYIIAVGHRKDICNKLDNRMI